MSSPVDHAQSVIALVIIAYVAIITAAGAYYSKFLRTADAYFRAGGAIPWWTAGLSMYMGNFTAYTFVGLASLVYVDGFAGLILETGPVLAFLLAGLVFAQRWHRLRLTSPPEYLEARFNPLTRKLFSMLGIATTLLGGGIRLYAVSKLIETFLGFPILWAIVLVAAVIVLYTMLGGLWGVVITEVLQFVILYLAVAAIAVGCCVWIEQNASWSEFCVRISETYSGWGGFPNAERGRTWGWLLAFWFAYLLDYNGEWGMIQKMCCTPTEHDARKAALLAAALSIPHAFLLLGPCVVARVFWQAEIADPNVIRQTEAVYGKIALKLLPAGMIGIVLAAMISSTLSTLSTAWNARATSLVNDLYVRFLRPTAKDREQILVGRLAVAGIGAIATAVGITIALSADGIFDLAQSLVGLVIIPLILPLLLGLIIPVANPWAGLFGLLAAFAFAGANRWASASWGGTAPLSFEVELFLSTAVTTVAMILSDSFGADADARTRTRAFFTRLRQPHPQVATDAGIPSPARIIGAFLILIGLLMGGLCLLAATAFDLATMGAATGILLGTGLTMRALAAPKPALEKLDRSFDDGSPRIPNTPSRSQELS